MMNTHSFFRSTGYMAITAAIIISVVMIVVSTSISFTSLFSRTDSLALSQKQRSLYAAQGCLEQALLNLSLNSSYTGNETVPITNAGTTVNCTIATITTQGSNKIIKSSAIVNDTTTNLKLTVNSSTLNRVSLEETAIP
jgi:hypothetical protein